MPGIAGIIARQHTGKEARELDVMLQCMMHEPFYTSGTHKNAQLGVHVAYVSIKGSFADCMPIYNEKRDLALFLSGECYADEEVISRLKLRGHEFSPGDASYLVHLYEEQREDFFATLNGWFSGILLDTQERRAILFNDRCGIQRVNYHENEDAFYFSSKATSLLKALPSLRAIDPRSVGEYVTFDCVLENRTYFPKVFILPPASMWRFANGNVEKRTYFQPSSLEDQPILSRDELLTELGETFKRIVHRYFSGKSVGLALTGGLDTRMTIASLNPPPQELPCYTFGGMYGDNLDVRLARRVAAACHQTHQVIRLDKTFLSEFPSHAERTTLLTDGLADVCQSDQIYLNNLARQIAPIKMTGKFGSQVLGRIRNMLRNRTPDERLVSHDFREYLSLANDAFSDAPTEHRLSFMLHKEIPWYWARFTTAELTQLAVRSAYLDNDLITVLYRASIGMPDGGPELHLRVIGETAPQLLTIRTDRGLLGRSSSLLSKPGELAYRVPATVDNMLHWDTLPCSLHHWVAKIGYLLSALHIGRSVLGMPYPWHYRSWFRAELSDYLREMLLDARTLVRPYWNRKFVEKMVYDHTNGRGHYLAEIRKMLTIELVHRVLIEAI